jgi:hypothetical protein
MNEQELANELGALLDGRADGSSLLPAEDAAFAAELQAMAEGTKTDTTFAATLETRLRAADSSFANRQGKTNRGRTIMTNRYAQRFATAAAIIAILAAATLTIPPLRTLAEDVLNLLFSRTPSDTVPFATPVVVDMQPTPISDAQTYVPLSIEEAGAIAGYEIHVPTFVPDGYVLTSVGYDDPATRQTSLFYAKDGYGVVIAQTPAELAKPLEVGATAAIQTVQIGSAVGEYVEGAWRVNPEVNGDTMTLTERTWDADFRFQQLRWQQGDRVYWMMSVPGQRSDLNLDDWLAIARSLG